MVISTRSSPVSGFSLFHNRGGALTIIPVAGEVSPEFVRSFFRLDDPLDQIFAIWRDDEYLQAVYNKYRGLRLIRQDPWECLIGFICSMASNIPRIRANIDTLASRFGKSIQDGISLVPTPHELSDTPLREFYEAKLGFRARYLHSITKRVHNGFDLASLATHDYQQAKSRLTMLYGVGVKVADCVLLFSCGQLEAFPVDTWITKVLETQYEFPSVQAGQLADRAREEFGRYAGYAQQYLFHAIRHAIL